MNPLEELDAGLAQRYGPFASYTTAADPILIETYGDGPAPDVQPQW